MESEGPDKGGGSNKYTQFMFLTWLSVSRIAKRHSVFFSTETSLVITYQKRSCNDHL